MSALMKRVLTSAAIIPIVILCLYWGSWPFYGLVLAVSLLAMFELKLMLGHMGVPINGMILYAFSLGVLTVIAWRQELWISPLIFITLLVVVTIELFSTVPQPFRRGGAMLLAVFYGAFLPGHFLLLRGQTHGFELLLLVLLGTWATDTGAYFAGLRWGRHRLAPRISPSKSVEGALGGVLFAVALLSYVELFLQLQLFPGWVLGLVIGFSAVVGDLFESTLKREVGVKDSGWILPGHGGILDRIDSLLFTVPVVYYLVRWLA